MVDYLDQWLEFMKGSDALLSLPLLAAGLTLTLAGWRLGRAAVLASLAVVGGVLGHLAGPSLNVPALGLLGCAAALGLAALLPTRPIIGLLGGAFGSALAASMLQAMGLRDLLLGFGLVAAFIAVAALAYVHSRNVLIAVTAFEGALLIVSAIFALGGQPHSMMSRFSSLIEGSVIMLPFALLVPTVVGCAIQLADANQKESGCVVRA